MKLRCLIVDDEPIAQEILEGYLEPFDQIEIVSKCSNAIEATKVLHETSIDLIFLDIEMPQVDGLSFIKNLEKPPMVIITTAYREYALEGHELNVVDYLLKPISNERFLKSINRVLAHPEKITNGQPYIYLKADMKMVQVFLDEIKYIQGLSNYVRVFCVDRTLITYQKISHLEEVLPGQFIRSHRSYIVNLHKVSSYTSQDLEIGDTAIPVGGNYRENLMAKLSRHQA
ncbi:LytTR family DNA-binding domain-containing protein [Ekhidna sp. MALMAid0563]|uniref:LytR/AlgR family response regulator transcription factor n=1 Tax=Ekhidna sp. MALMAid0563 TaxID=3143937 RepID=UPI0032DF1AE2